LPNTRYWSPLDDAEGGLKRGAELRSGAGAPVERDATNAVAALIEGQGQSRQQRNGSVRADVALTPASRFKVISSQAP
jgi:hypothetical protein